MVNRRCPAAQLQNLFRHIPARISMGEPASMLLTGATGFVRSRDARDAGLRLDTIGAMVHCAAASPSRSGAFVWDSVIRRNLQLLNWSQI
jgi:hypothetical protein